MNQTEKTIISMLSASIQEKNIDNLNTDNINWLDVFEEAQAHAITAFLYPLLKSLSQYSNIDEDVLTKWKTISLICGINQIRHINQMNKVFEAFRDANIPIVALKGLVIREFYPHPEFRNMSDADILVHKEDVEKSEKILMNLGYYKHSSIEIHSTFDHKNYLSIDLHWTLVNELHIKTVADFNKTLWENTRIITMNGLPVLSLSLEYELLHLILHIASHLIKSGFGVRLLCDVVVFIEKEKNNIDWNLFFEKVKLYNIEKLMMSIFIVCNQLFNMDLPCKDSVSYFQYNNYIELLINEIFSSGIYGYRNHTRVDSTKILHHFSNTDVRSTNKIKVLVSFLFPSSERINKKYSYAKRYPFLIPFAWLHKILFELSRNGLKFLKQIPHWYSAAGVAKERFRLLKWLQL